MFIGTIFLQITFPELRKMVVVSMTCRILHEHDDCGRVFFLIADLNVDLKLWRTWEIKKLKLLPIIVYLSISTLSMPTVSNLLRDYP